MNDTSHLQFLALQEVLVGRYSLEREIGRGGMGIVYLARDISLDRPVALKLLPPEYAAKPELRERFLREARTAAKLSHPHIVPIYSVEEVDDFVFFVMAYVEGETLGERVQKRGPLRAQEAARILREVSWALGFAHSQGVVHRDVKPDNILLEAGSRRALVTDFGIAQISDGHAPSESSDILGTAEFMSPEQAKGDPLDQRSDIYSLGVVGHYMVSGRLPFEGDSVAGTLAKHITQSAPPLASVAPEVPPGLGQAIDRCLSKDPAARFADGQQMADVLARSLSARQDVPVPLRVFAEQNREASASVGVVGFLGAVYVAVWIFLAVIGEVDFRDLAEVMPFIVFIPALAAIPAALLGHMARRLLRSGYGYDELIRALQSDVELRREELESEGVGGPTAVDRWARRLTVALGMVGTASLVSFLWLPYELWGPAALTGFVSWLGSAGVGLFAAVRHQVNFAVPGEGWYKFWKSGMGRLLFRAAGVRLGSVESSGAAFGPTEAAIGLAADRLFEELPKELRTSFRELPGVVRNLERDAEKTRARVAELTRLLGEVESERLALGSGSLSEAPGVPDKRATLEEELRKARDAAQARLSEALAALETIRLELLRMHAGSGSVASMTADLGSAKELSEEIERMLEGRLEVERLLRGG